MVTILPPRTDIGSDIGQGLGQGLGSGIAHGAQLGFQQQAIAQGMKNFQQANSAPERIQALAQLGTISPQAAQMLLPYVNSGNMVAALGGQPNSSMGSQGTSMGSPMAPNQSQGMRPQGSSSSQQSLSNNNANPYMGNSAQMGNFPNNMGTPPANITPGMDQQTQSQEQGLTSHIMSPEELTNREMQLAQFMPWQDAQARAQQEQDRAIQFRSLGESKARQVLGIGAEGKQLEGALATEADMPEIMMLGQQLSHITDPDRWARALKDSWQNYQSAKTSLSKAFVPGFFRKLMTSKADQQAALDRLVPISQKFVKLGMEQELRKQLLDRDLSETQVEAQIHPWTSKNSMDLGFLPKGMFRADTVPQNPEEMKERFPEGGLKSYDKELQTHPKVIEHQNTELANWMKKFVTPDMSLNVLRQKLWKHGYDWRQIGAAITEAQRGSNPLNLTQRQGIEETTVLTQPPLESLSDMLLGWDRPLRILQKAD